MPRGYPLLLPAGASVTGVLGVYCLGLTPPWRLSLAFGLALACLVWILTVLERPGRPVRHLVGIAAAFLLGLASASCRTERAETGLSRLPRKGRFEAEVRRVSGLDASSARPARLRIRKVKGGALPHSVTLWGYIPDNVTQGDVIVFDGTVRPLRSDDYWESILGASGVSGRVGVRRVERKGRSFSPAAWLYRFRAYLAERLKGKAYSGFFQGLILGDGRSLDQEVYVRAREGGTVHVLVVSGLHVGVAGGLAILLGRLLGLRIAARNLLAILITLIYAMLAGFGTSALRAWLMFSILVASPLLRREYDTVNSLAAAVLLLTLLRPEDMISRGFALSLAAISGILLASELMAYVDWERLTAWVRRPLEGLWISAGAWAGVAPLSAYFFGVLNPMAPLLSLVAVPVLMLFILTGWLVLAGETLAALLPGAGLIRFALGSDGPVYWLASGLGWLLDGVLDAGGLGRLGMFAAWGPNRAWLAAYYLMITVGVLFLREHRHLTKRLPESARRSPWKRPFFRRALAPALLALLIIWPIVTEAVSYPEEGLYFFSARQGEALAIVDAEAGILVLSDGLFQHDAQLRRTLRRDYTLVHLLPGKRLQHGRYVIETSMTGRAAWVSCEGGLAAWSLTYMLAVEEAAGKKPSVVVHTGRVSGWLRESTCGECRVIYCASGGGVCFLPAADTGFRFTRP